MVNYILGVIFGLLNGILNFSGQVLQKKAINDTATEKKEQNLMKSLTKNPLWILGLVVMFGGGIFLMLGQNMIGAALMPGLMACGFIVLAIGSVKILNETLKLSEIMAILLLIIAITLIGLSELTIESDITYFIDTGFKIRIGIATIIYTGLWLGLYYYGKKAKKFNSIFLALGTGFPFVISNIWMQPFLLTLGLVFTGNAELMEWLIFLIGLIYVAFGNIFGVIHYQNALNAGNASLIVPIQQMPQQIAPIITFYIIYGFASPKSFSLPFMIIGIILILIAGFVLAKRQVALEKIKN